MASIIDRRLLSSVLVRLERDGVAVAALLLAHTISCYCARNHRTASMWEVPMHWSQFSGAGSQSAMRALGNDPPPKKEQCTLTAPFSCFSDDDADDGSRVSTGCCLVQPEHRAALLPRWADQIFNFFDRLASLLWIMQLWPSVALKCAVCVCLRSEWTAIGVRLKFHNSFATTLLLLPSPLKSQTPIYSSSCSAERQWNEKESKIRSWQIMSWKRALMYQKAAMIK